MLSLEVLPARQGDALLASWGNQAHPHRLLVDAGTSDTARRVANRLREFDDPIDLLIVTHIDTDHIGGVLPLLKQPDIAARIRAIWFNGYQQLEQASDLLGALHGERLSKRIQQLRIPWNAGWGNPVSPTIGGPVMRDTSLPPPNVRLPGRAILTVLSPTRTDLAALLPVWEDTVRKAGLTPGAPPEPEPPAQPSDMLGGALDDLASIESTPDRSPTNGTSIAVLFSYGSRRILLCADAHADTLTDGLAALGAPVKVDACKLPHHGSRGNVSHDLVAALDCRQWIFSTSGEQFHHPHAEAFARVIRGTKNGPPVLIGNYASPEWSRLLADYPPQTNGFEIHLPPSEHPGLSWSPDSRGVRTDSNPRKEHQDGQP